MFENIGGMELLLILFVVFLFFGPRKLPEFGRNLGKGMQAFRKAMRDVQMDLDQATRDTGEPPAKHDAHGTGRMHKTGAE